MKKAALFSTAIALAATYGVLGGPNGIVATAEAGPPVSAGMADRYFQIQVIQTTGRDLGIPKGPRPNCYSFLGDGTWLDPLFLAPGTWEDTDGPDANTRYTATATSPAGVVVLEQEGQVTPSFSKGQNRLTAFSRLYIFGTLAAEFVSTGYEVDSCDP